MSNGDMHELGLEIGVPGRPCGTGELENSLEGVEREMCASNPITHWYLSLFRGVGVGRVDNFLIIVGLVWILVVRGEGCFGINNDLLEMRDIRECMRRIVSMNAIDFSRQEVTILQRAFKPAS